jgi:hypothetical protein
VTIIVSFIVMAITAVNDAVIVIVVSSAAVVDVIVDGITTVASTADRHCAAAATVI